MMNIVCDVLLCMFEIFIFYDFFNDILEKRTENRGIILTVLAVMTAILYAGLYYAEVHMEKGRMILCIGCVLLLISNIMVFYMIEKLTIVMEQNSAYECMDLQNRLNHTHYKRLEEVEERQRQYAHNLKEYLQTISVLAAKSKSEEIVDILKDMEVEVDSISDKIYTDNRILNALICEKELQAQKKEIEMEKGKWCKRV